MRICDTSFRKLVHKLVFILFEPGNLELEQWLSGTAMPVDDSVNGALCYGYVDHEAGFTFEVLCLGHCDPGSFVLDLLPGDDNLSEKLRKGLVDGSYVYAVPEIPEDDYGDKLELVTEGYVDSDAIEQVRALKDLDDNRHLDYPDDIMVQLKAQGEGSEDCELCWVRCEGAGEDGTFSGILQDEPLFHKTVHKGERVAFRLVQSPEGPVCVADV